MKNNVGAPKKDNPKKQITFRLSQNVINKVKLQPNQSAYVENLINKSKVIIGQKEHATVKLYRHKEYKSAEITNDKITIRDGNDIYYLKASDIEDMYHALMNL